MLDSELQRRELLKKIIILGATPLLLPGCSWFFSKDKKDGGFNNESELIVIGRRNIKGSFEVLKLSHGKVKTVSLFPSGFTPQSVSWAKDGTALLSGVNSQILLLINRSGKILTQETLGKNNVFGPTVYWESKNLFITSQLEMENSSGDIKKEGDKGGAKEKPLIVFRSTKTGKEEDRFVLDKSLNVVAMAMSDNDLVVLESSADTSKKPAQILKYSLEGKHFIYKMLIPPPFQPSVICVADKKCYIGLELKVNSEYKAAPILFFDMVANKQKF